MYRAAINGGKSWLMKCCYKRHTTRRTVVQWHTHAVDRWHWEIHVDCELEGTQSNPKPYKLYKVALSNNCCSTSKKLSRSWNFCQRWMFTQQNTLPGWSTWARSAQLQFDLSPWPVIRGDEWPRWGTAIWPGWIGEVCTDTSSNFCIPNLVEKGCL